MTVAVRVAALTFLLGGCGLYGEQGFWDNGTLDADDFVEESNELCDDALADHRSPFTFVAGLPELGEPERELLEDVSRDLDDLADDLDELKGDDDELKAARDALVASLTGTAERLDRITDSIESEPEAARKALTEAVTELRAGEKAARSAGFASCALLDDPQ